jgi:uncharacterized membrane protein YczE
MLKPIRWQTFARDFLMIQVGFALFGLSIALTIRANLGTGTWSVFEVALAQILGVTVGTISIFVGFGVLGGALILREQIGWGTLANILSIGPWLDLCLRVLPTVADNIPLQIFMLLAGVAIQGVASAVYIGVNAGAGPRDSLMLAVHRTTKVSIRLARAAIEVSVFVLGWLLGGPAGIGTIVFALLIGPVVQWAFRIFKVAPHRDIQADATVTPVLEN